MSLRRPRPPSTEQRSRGRALGALALAATLGLVGCFVGPMNPASPEPVPPVAPETAEHRYRRPDRVLTLGQLARGDTRAPDGRASSNCMTTITAGQKQDHLYGFEAPQVASYRFELSPQFSGVLQVQERYPNYPQYLGIGCAAAKKGAQASLSLPLNPGFYWVVVDGYEMDSSGPYTLRVDLDTSEGAHIRPEQAELVEPLCKEAPVFRPGERTFGEFRSKPGGARASCGAIGGNAVRRFALPAPARVRLVAAAHFTPAFEIRKACQGAALACARAPRGEHEVELVQDLEAGDYLLVLDATEVAPMVLGRNREGTGVGGAYVIDAEEVRQ